MVVRTRRGTVRAGVVDAQPAAGAGGSSAAIETHPPAPGRASRAAKRARPTESSGVDGGASDQKRKQRAKAVASPAEQEAVDEAQHKSSASVSKPSEAAGDSTKKVSVPLDDECSTCEPGAEQKASAGEDARQTDGGEHSQVKRQQQQQQQQQQEEEEHGAWPSDDDDDRGEFYCSDASQPEQSDSLFCTRPAACLDEEVVRARRVQARRVQQEQEVREVAELLGVDESCALLLLRSAAWNKEALLSNYMDDADKVCAAAGVPGPSTPLSAVKRSQIRTDFECRICRSDGELPVSSLACGHDFCDTCWEQYLTLKTEGGDVHICCPEPSCNLQVPSELVKRLCSEAINAKFHGFLLDSFVSDSKTSVWCPQPGCGLAVDSATAAGQGKFVTCRQGHSFCLECKREAHAPASCDCVKTWLQKCDDDSETFNWLAANTQDCPKCSSTIEKNGGCNHMTCRQCKYEFCWVCRGAWSLHGDAYSCNRWDDGELKEKEGSRKASRAALDRYLFHYHRYNNHELSRRLDQQNNARAAAKMTEIQEREPDRLWGDVQFVEQATVGLAACRLVLKWTYVLAHSLKDNSAEKNLFCFLQEDLESKTEQLSGLLESDVEKIMTPEVRNRVLNLSSVAEQSRRKLLRGVDEGLGGGGGGAAAAAGGSSSSGGGGGGGSTSAAAAAATAGA